MVKKTTLAIVALSMIAVLGWGFWLLEVIGTGSRTISRPATLELWRETCDAVVGGFGSCTSALSPTPITLPHSFNMKMSSIVLHDDRETVTLLTHYFGAQLDPGMQIIFSIDATAPIDFKLVVVNRTGPDVHALGNEVAHFSRAIIHAAHITSYYHELNVQEKGLYIFAFYVVEPQPVATVTFSLE